MRQTGSVIQQNRMTVARCPCAAHARAKRGIAASEIDQQQKAGVDAPAFHNCD